MALLSAQTSTINVPPIITIVNTTLDMQSLRRNDKVLRLRNDPNTP